MKLWSFYALGRIYCTFKIENAMVMVNLFGYLLAGIYNIPDDRELKIIQL